MYSYDSKTVVKSTRIHTFLSHHHHQYPPYNCVHYNFLKLTFKSFENRHFADTIVRLVCMYLCMYSCSLYRCLFRRTKTDMEINIFCDVHVPMYNDNCEQFKYCILWESMLMYYSCDSACILIL